MRSILLILLATACAHVPQPKLEAIVTATMRERGIPGAAVAIVQNDRLTYAHGFGVTNLATRTPVTANTIFQIASATKPFTAIAILELADQGKLTLGDLASRHLSWIPQQYANVTIEQLLTHTSGVARDLRRENIDEFDTDEFKRRLAASQPSFPPGEKWEYSNTGYALLSFIAEAAGNTTFGEFLAQHEFAPAGMTETGYRIEEHDDGLHAIGYDLVDGKPARAPHVFSGRGNSGIESTVLDLAKWIVALDRGKLLDESTVVASMKPHTKPFSFRGAETAYGYGWFITTTSRTPLVTHGGAIAGFSSIIDRYPQSHAAIIVLCNGKQGSDGLGQAEAISRTIATLRGMLPPRQK